MKFGLLMLSNISDIFATIPKRTVELKRVFLFCLPKQQQQQQNGGQCKYAIFLINTSF